MCVQAVAVVGKDFDHTTIGHLADGAAGNHAFEFDLQRGQAGDALGDFRQACGGDGVSRGAGLVGLVLESEQCADRVHIEAKLVNKRRSRPPLIPGLTI